MKSRLAGLPGLSAQARRTRRAAAACLVFAAVGLSGCQLVQTTPDTTLVVSDTTLRTATPVAPTVPAQGVYRLKPGDTVNVFVFDNADLSQSAVITPDGRLNYPLAGSIQAKGRTLREIERILTSRFSNNIFEPQVSVSLSSIGPQRVYVNGEVIQPGAFDLREPVTLVQAISLAGGFTAFAKRDRIIVYNPSHPGNARRVFDYDAFVANPNRRDILLVPGDTVIVQ